MSVAGHANAGARTEIGPPALDAERREFRPEREFASDRSGPVRWIRSHLRRYPHLVAGFFSAMIGVSAMRVGVPILVGAAFDLARRAVEGGDADAVGQAAQGVQGALIALLGGIAGGPEGQLLAIGGLILAASLLQGAMDLSGSLAIETLGQRLERDAREELYVSLLGKSQTWHGRQRVGDLMARAANDVRQLNPMLNPGIALIVDSAASLALPLLAIAALEPRLLVVPVIYTVLFGFALRRYVDRLTPVSAELRMRFGQLNASLAETITGIEVVKAAAQEPAERAKFHGASKAYRDTFVRQGQVQARYLPPLLLGVAFAAALWHGMALVQAGTLSVGELIAFLGLLNVLRYPTFVSIFTFALVQMGIAGAGRILELLQATTELDENPSGIARPIKGEIAFEGASLRLGGRLVLQDITFTARPGQTVAIVGQAGSGKSLLTRLVERLYDVDAGCVLVDGIDVRDWSLDGLRSQISVIEQDVFLFSRSVAENIAFGLGQAATREAVVAAAIEAQADGFVRALPDGYDTVIGERGATLSGGQRQRLAIARALLTDPRILILDDATSAIDSATEDEIQRAILRVQEGRTVLMITHRLSQIRWADHILVLEDGRLVDQGTHAELVANCALYRRIFQRDATREQAI